MANLENSDTSVWCKFPMKKKKKKQLYIKYLGEFFIFYGFLSYAINSMIEIN